LTSYPILNSPLNVRLVEELTHTQSTPVKLVELLRLFIL